MARFKEAGGTKDNPATVKSIHEKLQNLEEERVKRTKKPERTIDYRTLSRNLRQLLGGADEIKQMKETSERF